MGYFLRTKAGLKGPVEPELIRKLVDAGKLRLESTVVDEEGDSLPVSRALGIPDAPPEADLDLSALDAYEESQPAPSLETAEPPPVPMEAPAPRRPAAPKRGTGAGVRPAPGRRKGRAAGRAGASRTAARGLAGARGASARMAPHRLGWATGGLRILMVLYFLFGIICVAAGMMQAQELEATGQQGAGFMQAFGVIMGLAAAGFGVLMMLVAKGIDNRRPWARGVGIAIGVLSIPSVTLPIGIFIVLGLTNANSAAQFR